MNIQPGLWFQTFFETQAYFKTLQDIAGRGRVGKTVVEITDLQLFQKTLKLDQPSYFANILWRIADPNLILWKINKTKKNQNQWDARHHKLHKQYTWQWKFAKNILHTKSTLPKEKNSTNDNRGPNKPNCLVHMAYAQGKTDTETNFVVTVGFMTKVDDQTTLKT